MSWHGVSHDCRNETCRVPSSRVDEEARFLVAQSDAHRARLGATRACSDASAAAATSSRSTAATPSASSTECVPRRVRPRATLSINTPPDARMPPRALTLAPCANHAPRLPRSRNWRMAIKVRLDPREANPAFPRVFAKTRRALYAAIAPSRRDLSLRRCRALFFRFRLSTPRRRVCSLSFSWSND
jgi:hypothetical protein